MRAVSVLLCLALARYSMASIFRHQFQPQMDSLIVHPLDYVDQYQQQAMETNMRNRRGDTTSEESKERLNYDDINDYPSPLRQFNRNWNSPLLSAVIPKFVQDDEIPYGDVITWHDVQIAAGPKSPVTKKKDIERIFRDAYKTLQHVSKEDKKKIHSVFEEEAMSKNEDVNSNATELLKKHGYGVKKHIVKTDDGYNLTLFRMQSKQESHEENQSGPHEENQSGPQETKKKPVVFLMHGLLGSADDWLLMGPEKSLAYLLADAGYDVWLGNARGNKYSRHHASKHASHPDFWHFSIDEIALHDLPAMIDYALKTSQQKKLYYVGHSQGTTVFFAYASTNPEHKDKIEMMHALSPMVYMSNTRSPLLRMIAPSSHFYDRLHDQLGHGEFKPSKEVINTAGGNMCNEEIGCKHVCSNVNYVMTGVDTAGTDVELIPVIVNHLPAGASTRQIKQYGQAVSAHELRKYDYGTDINKKIYGTRNPPKYNMTEVKVPVKLYYSEEDWLAHPKDVERLQKELPNAREAYKVPEKHFSHMDFQFSQKAPQAVYQKLIESIKQHQQTDSN